MSPPPVVLLIILVVSAIISLAIYALALRSLYAGTASAYERVSIFRLVLDDELGRAFELGAFGPAAGQPARSVSADYRVPVEREVFEALRRLGVVEADRRLEEFSAAGGRPVAQRNAPVRALMDAILSAANAENKDMRSISAVWMASRLAARFGAEQSGGGTFVPDCWSAALTQVLAAYPSRSEAFFDAVRDRRQRQPGGSGSGEQNRAGCPWLGSGALKSAPSPLSFAFIFGVATPHEVDIARALFLLSGAIPADDPTRISRGPTPDDEARQLAEQTARAVLSRVRTAPDVTAERFWLDMIVGWPQLLMLWVSLLLCGLLAARFLMRKSLQSEISLLRLILDRERPGLVSSDGSVRADAAEKLVRLLDSWLVGSQPNGKVELERSESHHGRGGTEDQQILPLHRKESLALLMASKAVKRLVVGEAQPELFREFCATRRAMVDESTWFLRYLVRALPALGFIGTVLGILYGLGGADVIVRASGPDERAAAMSQVTGPLALAFSTTFFALAAGLALGLLVDREAAQERLVLLEFEEELIERIDPAERNSQDAGR